MPKERIEIDTPYDKTVDQTVTIVGNYWQGLQPKAVLLLHMMPTTKESWDEFAEKLVQEQFHVLAIDLRGHGESTTITTESPSDTNNTKTPLHYESFSDEEHQLSIIDVEKAINWLANQGIDLENIVVGGASIGANLAIQILAENHSIKHGFALSPGLDYRGIKTNNLFYSLSGDQRLLLITADDDPKSAETVAILQEIAQLNHKPQLKVLSYDSGGHGTNLLSSKPEVSTSLIEWLHTLDRQ